MDELTQNSVTHYWVLLNRMIPELEERWKSLPGLEKYPVRHTLNKAYLERWDELVAAVNLGAAGLEALYASRPEFAEELRELGSWLHAHKPLKKWPAPRRIRAYGLVAEATDQAGFLSEEITSIVECLDKGRMGRPRDASRIIDALDMKLAEHKTPTQVASVLCDCNLEARGMTAHDYDCGERLRQQMNRLEVVFNKYR